MNLRNIIGKGLVGLIIVTTSLVGIRAISEIGDTKEFYKNEASFSETVGKGLIPERVNIECKCDVLPRLKSGASSACCF